MPESADLLAAVAAAPADDLPRLVYADWLDDRGEPDHATFVRDQIRLAQVPSWDPLAVRARHQRKESLGIGRPFYGTLPDLPLFLKWHPEKAFRRGFGTGVVVNQLSGLIEAGPHLFDLAPVDELWLGAASLDEWRTVARSPWLKNIRKVHLHFSQSLHEPIRCLAESPYSGNIDEIWFDTLATPAAGAVIEILAQSPLARQLKGLHMRLVHTPSLPEVIAALAGGMFERLERFSMVQAGLTSDTLRSLRGISQFQSVREVNLTNNTIVYWWDSDSELTFLGPSLRSLTLDYCKIEREPEWYLIERMHKNKAKPMQISIGGNVDIGRYFTTTTLLDSVRCICVEANRLKDNAMVAFLNGPIWPGIIEVNWANNRLNKIDLHQLYSSSIPPFLTVFRLSKHGLVNRTIRKLESHFGDRLVWAAEDAATGLAR